MSLPPWPNSCTESGGGKIRSTPTLLSHKCFHARKSWFWYGVLTSQLKMNLFQMVDRERFCKSPYLKCSSTERVHTQTRPLFTFFHRESWQQCESLYCKVVRYPFPWWYNFSRLVPIPNIKDIYYPCFTFSDGIIRMWACHSDQIVVLKVVEAP